MRKTIQLTTFSDLGLNANLLSILKSQGYVAPTPIQAQAIPSMLDGRDIQGIAQTGTGKTAAFALPILHRLAENPKKPQPKGCRALVLSPTRELASQIAQSFKTYGASSNIRVATIFGGVGIWPQVNVMRRGVDCIVATPGRLIDHLEQRTIKLAGTEILVLDEADQMLDMGFIRPIRQIVSKLSTQRQTLFFSATMPREIGKLASELLHNPLHISVAPQAKTADRVNQSVIHVDQPKKNALLVELFSDPAMERAIVFTRTKRGADKVARKLAMAGIKVAAIHGNKSQSQRQKALKELRDGRIRGLVATDIAARGIDIDDVTHVVNFELPNIPESYVHRIGRTARAGATGVAISFCSSDERTYLTDIERVIRKKIACEDRRGDTSLVADKRDGGGNDGKRKGTSVRSASEGRRSRPKSKRRSNNRGGQTAAPGAKPKRVRRRKPRTSARA